jgi:hypothetical protein
MREAATITNFFLANAGSDWDPMTVLPFGFLPSVFLRPFPDGGS